MTWSMERNEHCPFLNRADSRCGEHFHLDQLDHAFEFCFDRYTACPTYLERLVERRLRQDEQPETRNTAVPRSLVQVTIHAAGRSRADQPKPAAAYVADAGHEVDAEPIAVTLGREVSGPRFSAYSIFRGFDRIARSVIHRDVAHAGAADSAVVHSAVADDAIVHNGIVHAAAAHADVAAGRAA